MTNSKGSSVVIGDERAQDGLLAVMVVPDGSSESKQSLQHPGHDALGSVSSVSFQVELAFQGFVDRLDELRGGLQDPRTGSRSRAFLGRSDESCALAGKGARLIRPAQKGAAPRPGARVLKPPPQLIESVNETLKGQLDLERHGGHTPQGVVTRVLQRLLALTAAIWHNHHRQQPVLRSLIAYDH